MTGERSADRRSGGIIGAAWLAGAIAAARGLLRPCGMKLLMKMLGIGAIVAAAIYYDRRRLRLAGRLDVLGTSGVEQGAAGVREEVVTDAVIISVGIADVDPVPLANVAGEGIDPDAVDEAHRSVTEQRERLPVSGKNIP